MKLRHAILSAGVAGMAAVAVAAAGPAVAATPHALGAGAGYTPVAPIRVLDTRSGIGGPEKALFTNETRKLDLSSAIPSDATAVVLNVTAVLPDSNPGTFVTVWPDGTARPNTSNINPGPADEQVGNLVTVLVPADRTVDFFNHDSITDLVADLEGYYTPGQGAGYTALTPASRVLDTRNDVGTTQGTLGANTTRTLSLAGTVPAGTTAVTLNLTATNATASSFVTVWPADQTLPTASNLNTTVFTDVANLVTVKVSSDLKIDLYNHVGSVDLIADLAGYYTPGAGSGFTPITPQRVLDTRNGTGGPQAPLGAGTIRTLNLSGAVPAGSTSVLINLTGVSNFFPDTFVTAWPDGAQQPVTSNLNIPEFQTVANLASVALPADNSIDLFNNAGNVDLVGDVAGYFGPAGA